MLSVVVFFSPTLIGYFRAFFLNNKEPIRYARLYRHGEMSRVLNLTSFSALPRHLLVKKGTNLFARIGFLFEFRDRAMLFVFFLTFWNKLFS